MNEDSLPNIINIIQKRRTKENYKEILSEYIKENSDIRALKTKEILFGQPIYINILLRR